MFSRFLKKKVEPEKRRSGRVVSTGRVKKSPKDVTDYKRFVAVEAQMNALNLDLNRYGDDTEAAIVNHRTSPTGIRKSPFVWKAPPANPDGTPYNDEALKDRLGKNLNAEDINKLKVTNNLFRARLADLDAIREWWTKNRKEWDLRRQDFQYIQASIDGLLSQLGGEANIEKSKYADARKQYYLQVEVANSRLEWFSENEEMMKNVVNKFKEIRTKVEETVTKFKNAATVPWDFPANFSLEEEYTLFDFKENKVPWWNKGRGFFDVSVNLRGYIAASMDELRAMEEDRLAQEQFSKLALVDFKAQAGGQGDPQEIQKAIDKQWDDYREAGQANWTRRESILDNIKILENNKLIADRVEAERADYAKALQEKGTRLRAEINLLTYESLRGRSLRSLARDIEAKIFRLGNPMSATELRDPVRLTYIQHWYMIVRVHYLHNKNILTLLATLDADDLQSTDVTAILDLLAAHQTEYQENILTIINTIARHLTISARTGTSRIWNPEDIREKVWYNFEYEYEDMDNLVATATGLLKERRAELAQELPTFDKMREVSLGDGALALNKVIPAVSSKCDI